MRFWKINVRYKFSIVRDEDIFNFLYVHLYKNTAE